jgi:hypothetical protein
MKSKRCSKVTNTGSKCLRRAPTEEEYCWQHKNPNSLETRGTTKATPISRNKPRTGIEKARSTRANSKTVSQLKPIANREKRLDVPYWSKQRCTAPDVKDNSMQCKNYVRVFMSDNKIKERKSFFCKRHSLSCGEARGDYKHACGETLPSCRQSLPPDENSEIERRLVMCAEKRESFTETCVASQIRDYGHEKIIEIAQNKADACDKMKRKKRS